MSEQGNIVDIIAILDQLESHLINQAKAFGKYKEELVENGISPGVAEQMVLDYHRFLLTAHDPRKK